MISYYWSEQASAHPPSFMPPEARIVLMSSFVRFCLARPNHQVRVHIYWFPHHFLVQSTRCALTHWLGISTAFLTVSSSKSGSEWVNMVRRIGPAALFVGLVYECPCVTLCVCFTSISLWASTETLALCYCCKEPGICSPCALSPQLTDKWSCMVSCPLPPLPSASSARSAQLRMWRDWPTILGATCQSARADWLPLCAGTVERKHELSAIISKHILTSSIFFFLF